MDYNISLVPQTPIDLIFKGEVIGRIKALSIDLSDVQFWMFVPKMKLQISLYSKFHYADMIKSKLRKFKFIEIEEITSVKKLETTLEDLSYEMIGK